MKRELKDRETLSIDQGDSQCGLWIDSVKCDNAYYVSRKDGLVLVKTYRRSHGGRFFLNGSELAKDWHVYESGRVEVEPCEELVEA